MTKNERIFLLMDYSDLKANPNQTSPYSICLNQNLPMGLYSNLNLGGVTNPYLSVIKLIYAQIQQKIITLVHPLRQSTIY